ncbi:hypothetical protein ERJ75_000343000 [Trypanosoma vivax]|uniref:Uncharacterized protein n=1 Tax=Trypanosoma vivax (strain Y486) TaxID=1055687 RepID=F9WMQ6_TRYVY|nr:hypothetical protein ERJ75_000343000 [Trypanosoma vivax]CCD18817.1 hypothetical protein, conserved in T. vivax [Trypanosoma vivax Y486]|eukprot:CCD18817.1 hypothetical protein, conserved in T. vivax [Trypanosoma vivax Y486]
MVFVCLLVLFVPLVIPGSAKVRHSIVKAEGGLSKTHRKVNRPESEIKKQKPPQIQPRWLGGISTYLNRNQSGREKEELKCLDAPFIAATGGAIPTPSECNTGRRKPSTESKAVSSGGGAAQTTNEHHGQVSSEEDRVKQTSPGVSQQQQTAVSVGASTHGSGSSASIINSGTSATSGEDTFGGKQKKEVSEKDATRKPGNGHSPGDRAKGAGPNDGEAKVTSGGRFEQEALKNEEGDSTPAGETSEDGTSKVNEQMPPESQSESPLSKSSAAQCSVRSFIALLLVLLAVCRAFV